MLEVHKDPFRVLLRRAEQAGYQTSPKFQDILSRLTLLGEEECDVLFKGHEAELGKLFEKIKYFAQKIKKITDDRIRDLYHYYVECHIFMEQFRVLLSRVKQEGYEISPQFQEILYRIARLGEQEHNLLIDGSKKELGKLFEKIQNYTKQPEKITDDTIRDLYHYYVDSYIRFLESAAAEPTKAEPTKIETEQSEIPPALSNANYAITPGDWYKDNLAIVLNTVENWREDLYQTRYINPYAIGMIEQFCSKISKEGINLDKLFTPILAVNNAIDQNLFDRSKYIFFKDLLMTPMNKIWYTSVTGDQWLVTTAFLERYADVINEISEQFIEQIKAEAQKKLAAKPADDKEKPQKYNTNQFYTVENTTNSDHKADINPELNFSMK